MEVDVNRRTQHQTYGRLVLIGIVVGWSAIARAETTHDFYKGKTITMVVPADPGGSYDLHTRIVARYIRKWIPGQPNVVVQNMQGAGGLRAINYLYEKAPRDGTVLGIPVQENVIADVLGGAEVRYKIPEFNWIGRLALGVDFIVTWHTLGVKTMEDAKQRVLPIGATSFASGTALYPLMLNNTLGTKFNIVSGYKHNHMLLAVERGETAGAFTSLVTLKSAYPRWLTEKKVDFLVAFANERTKELPDIPTLVELARNPEERQIFSIFSSAPTIGRSFLTTPRVPAERVAALRAAFDAMVKDSEFIAEIEKTHTEFSPLGGEALQTLVADTRNVPATIMERARAVVKR